MFGKGFSSRLAAAEIWEVAYNMDAKESALIVLVVLLLAVTVVQAYQATQLSSKATALATGNFKVAGSGSYDGYSSYDEMMAAHHGGGAATTGTTTSGQGIGGCN